MMLQDERANSLVSLILILGIVALMLGTLARVSGHNLTSSGADRELTRAFHAAEAGAQRTAGRLAYDGCYAGYATPQQVAAPAPQPPIGTFTTTITRGPGCPGATPPQDQTIVSTGSSSVDGNDKKRVQLNVKLYPRLGFNEALFAGTTLTWGSKGTVTGKVFANQALTLSSPGTVVNGDVVSPSSIATLDAITVNGDVFAADGVSLSSATNVVGDVTSAGDGFTLSNDGTISGTAKSGGPITGGGTAGLQIPNSVSVPPATRTLATHDGSCPAGGNLYSGSGSAATFNSFWSANAGAINGVFCVFDTLAGGAVVRSPTTTTSLSGDLTIITNPNTRVELRGSIVSKTPRRLVIISNSASTTSGSEALRVVPASTSPPMIIATAISTLLYAPGAVRIDYTGDMVGCVYGGAVTVTAGMHSLRFTPAFSYPNEPAGFDFHVGSSPRFDVQSKQFREVSVS